MMTMNEAAADIDDEFARYFRARGLVVTWDFNRRQTERWYEILKNGKLLMQVDMGTPLAAFLEDLPHFARGEDQGTSAGPEYKVNGTPETAAELLAIIESSR
jgi:hypothetical protein